jgi:pilus assembly protein Flp/PilA
MMKFRNLLDNLVVKLVREEEGQTMAEYGILVAVIALIAIVGATVFGGQLSTFFSSLGGKLGG